MESNEYDNEREKVDVTFQILIDHAVSPVKYLNIDTNIFIIRAHRDLFHLLASALVFVRSIKMGYREPNLDVILKTLHVGGETLTPHVNVCNSFSGLGGFVGTPVCR